jgi:hypothetical protein
MCRCTVLCRAARRKGCSAQDIPAAGIPDPHLARGLAGAAGSSNRCRCCSVCQLLRLTVCTPRSLQPPPVSSQCLQHPYDTPAGGTTAAQLPLLQLPHHRQTPQPNSIRHCHCRRTSARCSRSAGQLTASRPSGTRSRCLPPLPPCGPGGHVPGSHKRQQAAVAADAAATARHQQLQQRSSTCTSVWPALSRMALTFSDMKSTPSTHMYLAGAAGQQPLVQALLELRQGAAS